MGYFNENIAEINGLNQRGGRMLSIIDLVNRETLTREIAAYLIGAIHKGASFLCCALPGGVGKTTLMGALLGLVPSSERLESITSPAHIETLEDQAKNNPGKESRLAGNCYIVHEIGKGSWFGYLWGSPVLKFMGLRHAGARIASNIHADTFDQIVEQIQSFGGSSQDLTAFDLILFIKRVKGQNHHGHGQRIVDLILECKQESGKYIGHVPIFDRNMGDLSTVRLNEGFIVEKEVQLASKFVEKMLDDGIFTIDEVCTRLEDFREKLNDTWR